MKLTTERIQQIIAAVDQGFDEQIAFTRELVRHPSLRGQERSAQQFIYDALSKRGYKMDQWAIDVSEIEGHPGYSPVTVDYSNAINVVATHQPTAETGRSLILNGHIDVVPEGPLDQWQSPPFEPRIDSDWLYGRGSGDMKAGLVANIFALDALRRIGLQPAATVHLQSVTEEECTGNGALSALVRGYRADAAIIPEPTQESLVRGNTGVIWFRVHVKGNPVHALKASKGCNAIDGALRIIQALKKLEAAWNDKKHDLRYYRDHDKPINFLVGKINGGDWPSSVPAWCDFDVRASLFPGEKAADAAREIEAFIQQTCAADPELSELQPEIEYHGFFAEGYVLEEGTEAEATLVSAHQQSFDQTLRAELMPCYLDARVFMLYDDCPTLVYGPLSENIHGFNERVRLSSIKQITRSIALFVAQWCGLEAIAEPSPAEQKND